MHVALCNSVKTKRQQNFNNARINSLRLEDGGESSTSIEIINNTRGGIVIFFTEKKGNAFIGGANSSPGCRARRLLAELMLP